MKNVILILWICAVSFSCGSETNNTPAENSIKELDQTTEIEKANDEPNKVAKLVSEEPENFKGDASMMLGTWSGVMNEKKISVVIESVNETTITGYNVLGTNKRDIKGTYEQGIIDQPCARAFDASLAEPGDDKWDGEFQIHFIGYENTKEADEGIVCMGGLKGYEAYGEWKSNNGKLSHHFDLIKK